MLIAVTMQQDNWPVASHIDLCTVSSSSTILDSPAEDHTGMAGPLLLVSSESRQPCYSLYQRRRWSYTKRSQLGLMWFPKVQTVDPSSRHLLIHNSPLRPTLASKLTSTYPQYATILHPAHRCSFSCPASFAVFWQSIFAHICTSKLTL